MRFRPGARLDTGQIEDRRGGRSGFGGRGVAVGGGAGGILLLLVIALLDGNPFSADGTNALSLGSGQTGDNTTHGSARQRQRWFTIGYRTGDRSRCNTFTADAL